MFITKIKTSLKLDDKCEIGEIKCLFHGVFMVYLRSRMPWSQHQTFPPFLLGAFIITLKEKYVDENMSRIQY